MACDTRLIISRTTGEEVESKTWKDIYDHTGDEQEADRLYEQLLSPEFSEWFGDWVNDPANASKVVNEHGEPLLVYHGSNKEFHSFENKGHEKMDNKIDKDINSGMFFSDDPFIAATYGTGMYKDNYAVFLDIKNPATLTKTGLTSSTAIQYKETNDGAIGLEPDHSGTNYVVFDPNQIKSLTNTGEYSKDSDNIYYQADSGSTVSSKASDVTVDKWKGWFKDNGVDYEAVTGKLVDEQGNELKANEKVDVVNKIVKVVEGLENTTIPEAGMHIVARIIKEQQPKLYKEMLNKIGTYKIYETVLTDYRNFPNYQLADGKSDIAKIKEETIGKVLAEYYIDAQEGLTEKPELLERVKQAQTWWQRIKEYLKDFFQGNPFTKAVKQFDNDFSGKSNRSTRGTEETEASYNRTGKTAVSQERQGLQKEASRGEGTGEILSENKPLHQRIGGDQYADRHVGRADQDWFYQASEGGAAQERGLSGGLQDDDRNSRDAEGKGETVEGRGPDLGEKLFNRLKASPLTKIPGAEGNKRYEGEDDLGAKFHPEKTVTDFSQAVYDKAFGKRFENTRDKQKETTDKETGTRLHSYIEDIINRAVDTTTGLRKGLDKTKGTILPGEEHIYDNLETYVLAELDKYPENTRFITEQVVYKGGKKPGSGDVAGTIDFLAITPDGTVYNKDWKFMNNNNKEDISNVTQQAHKVQMGQYGEILRSAYGVKNIRESNTVPFNLIYGNDQEKYTLKDVTIGNTNYGNINNKTLLPVTSNQVQLEDPKLTAFVQNLHKLLQKLYDQKVPIDQRAAHSDRVQELSHAIRTLVLKGQMAEVTTVALNMVRGHLKDLEDIKEYVDDPEKRKNTSAADKGRLVDKLIEAAMGLDVFRDMRTNLGEYTKDMKPVEKEALNRMLTKINDNIKYATDLMYDKLTGKGILEKVGISIGDEYNIYNLLTMDKNLNRLQRNFNASSSITFKTGQLWSKIRAKAQNVIEMKARDAATAYEKLNHKLTEWMGGTYDNQKIIDAAFQKTEKGNWKPFLLHKTSDKFFTELNERLAKPEDEDRAWVMKNIDTDRYKKDYQQELEKRIATAETTVFDANSFQEDPDKRKGTLDQELREKSIETFKNTYDIFAYNSAFSFKNKWLRNYANKENWSDGYKNLNKPENQAALDFYNQVIEINKRARDLGILGNYYRQFFPQVALTSKQLGIKGEFAAARDKFLHGLEVGTQGRRDPLTGEAINGIHAAYTMDMGIDGEYLNVSDDVMKSLNMFTREVIAAEELSKIEGIAKALVAIEKTKGTLIYDKGKLQKDVTGKPEVGKNEFNAKWLEDQVNYDLYGKKHIGEEKGKDITIAGKTYHMSYAKIVDTLVNGLSLKALGLNPASALSNWFGGSSNTLILSGKNFTKEDLAKSYSRVTGAQFYSEEGKKLISLLEHFTPFTEDISKELGRKMGKKEMLNWLSGEGLMYFMRKSEKVIQMVNADVYFQNTMVHNGELVNIPEFVRSKYDYDNLYRKPDAERRSIQEIVAKEVKKLQDTKNLYNDKSIDYNKETFGVKLGVERASNSEVRLRQQIQQLTRNVVGNRTPDEMAHINMHLFGSALTQFHNWIPRMAQQRYGSFSYSSGEGSYEIGKMWMVGDVLKDHTQSKIKNLMDVLSFANLGGSEATIIGVAKRQYQRRLAEQSEIEGTDQSMFAQTVSEADFVDNYIHSVKAQVREIQAMLIMMGAFWGALAWAKALNQEDEDYTHRGLAKWSVKMLDKFSDELGFFYSPNSFKSLIGAASGSVLPLFGVANDLTKFVDHLGKDIYYRYIGDENALDKNKVLKYPISYIPAVNQLSAYLGIFSEDWGKEMGYKQSYTYKAFGN